MEKKHSEGSDVGAERAESERGSGSALSRSGSGSDSVCRHKGMTSPDIAQWVHIFSCALFLFEGDHVPQGNTLSQSVKSLKKHMGVFTALLTTPQHKADQSARAHSTVCVYVLTSQQHATHPCVMQSEVGRRVMWLGHVIVLDLGEDKSPLALASKARKH